MRGFATLRQAGSAICVAVVAPLSWTGEAAALQESDILGKWCKGPAGVTEFTRDSMNIVRASDQAKLQFRIKNYEYTDDVIKVYWVGKDGADLSTSYGKFDKNRRTMVQLKTSDGPERPHRRC